MTGRFVRLAETDRRTIELVVDGKTTEALDGDSLLVAILGTGKKLRRSEFGDGNRAGFCLMGACQDCWVSTETGERLRACSTSVQPGMRICTTEITLAWTDDE